MIWLSANKFGYNLFLEAKKHCTIDAIITLKSNSKTVMYDSVSIHDWYSHDIPVYELSNINDEISVVKHLKTRLLVSCGWRQLISKKILDDYTVIGFHPTLLPYGRGRAPIINTILQGLDVSGVTMFYMDDGVDSGDIIGQSSFYVSRNDYANDVYEKSISAGIKLIIKFLSLVESNKAPRRKQKSSGIHYFVAPETNEIFTYDDAETVYRKIRAFSRPYNGAFIIRDNKKLIHMLKQEK